MLGISRRAARVTWTVVLVLLFFGLIYKIRATLFVFVVALLFALPLQLAAGTVSGAMHMTGQAGAFLPVQLVGRGGVGRPVGRPPTCRRGARCAGTGRAACACVPETYRRGLPAACCGSSNGERKILSIRNQPRRSRCCTSNEVIWRKGKG